MASTDLRVGWAGRGPWFDRVLRSLVPAFFVCLLGLSLVAPLPSGGAVPQPFLTPAPNGVGAATPTLSLANATVLSTVGSQFWGADARPYYTLGAPVSVAFQSSGLAFIRWPGGAVADRYNISANVIYNDTGTYYSPPTNITTFVQWCRSVGCQAILGLPAEIDEPATAAYYVHYVEQVVGFTPAYWEIGNEPAVWTHYGIPWSKWATTQNLNITPAPYAQLVHDYIAAIRAVDSHAHLVALGGLGTGAWGETTWIQATVGLNGPNLSAISIHVYPAGGPGPLAPTLAQFYWTLDTPSALANRVPSDRSAIASACATCRITLLATELGSGTAGGAYSTWMGNFAVVPYLASEVVDALALNLTNVDLFALESSYDGSILDQNGTPTSVSTLYQTFFAPLQPVLLSAQVATTVGGFSTAVTRNVAGSMFAVLAVNTNTSSSVGLTVRTTPGSTAGTLWVWNASLAAPKATTWASGLPPTVRVGPESVVLVVATNGVPPNRVGPVGLPGGTVFPGSVPPRTVTGILSLLAPTSLTFPCWAVASARRGTTPGFAAWSASYISRPMRRDAH
jgi:hypothetical protein